MKDFISYFYQTILDFDLILRFAFSAGLLYGSFAVSLLLTNIPVRFPRVHLAPRILERLFFLGFLAVFMISHFLPVGEGIQAVLIALFIIAFFCLFILYEHQKQYGTIKEGFLSFAESEPKLNSRLRVSFVRRNFLFLIAKYHYRFWMVLLFYEVISETVPGIGGAVRLALREWNSSHSALVFLFIIAVLFLLDLVLRLSEISITPWREELEK